MVVAIDVVHLVLVIFPRSRALCVLACKLQARNRNTASKRTASPHRRETRSDDGGVGGGGGGVRKEDYF